MSKSAPPITIPRRPQILCVMRMPPNPNGHGGSQRAWHLLHALMAHGDVHFVLVYRDQDQDCTDTPLSHLEPLVASVTRINIAEWQPAKRKHFGVVPGGVWDVFTMGSQDAPRFSSEQLQRLARQLPLQHADVIFAGRLCVAVMLQALIDRHLLWSPLRIVDFDDIMSKFAIRKMRSEGTRQTLYRRVLTLIDALILSRCEAQIADRWHGVSVCTDADVDTLRSAGERRSVVKVPNIVARRRLEPRIQDGRFRILFTGNLGFAPNIEGLRLFIEQAWPVVVDAVPQAELAVVGLNPGAPVVQLAKRPNMTLDANVPSLEPYYRKCDVVIAPILFGSGTRIKILEAMAYGRPVVSTTVGAEGMGLQHGKHLLLADTMDDFARALIAIANVPELAARLTESAHQHQQAHYTETAFNRAVTTLIDDGRRKALPLAA